MEQSESTTDMSLRVMKLDEFADSIYFRVACQCGEQNCDLVLEMEYDKTLDSINIHIYKNLVASAHWGIDWNHFDFIRVLWNKIKICWTIITKGHMQVSEETMIQGEEHIDNFIAALQQGKKFIVGKESEWQEYLKSQKEQQKNLLNSNQDK